MSQEKTVAFYTLGCKVNSYDTEAMMELFERSGYKIVDFKEPADIYIINTCTVTAVGDKKSRQMLRRAKRQNPESLVIATGCYAQTAPEALDALEEVDIVVGNTDRSKIVEIAQNHTESVYVPEFKVKEEFDNLPISRSEGHTRAYVKVQEGCRQYCSYCIVPYARGPLRSRDKKDALEEISALAKNGYQEIVLTGIHIASYGKEKGEPEALIELIEEAAKIPGIKRIRLSSLEPNLITRDFLDRLKQVEAFCPHFHLSLQSGSATTLKAMNRHYTPEEYLEKVKLIREAFPLAAVTTDVIVGFPGESQEDFKESLDFAKTVGFSQMHIFPYSKREGTPAAAFENQVEGPEKTSRAKTFSRIEKELRQLFLEKNDGKLEEVLFERETEPGIYSGHTKNYIPVLARSEENLSGKIRDVVLEYTKDEKMLAHLLTGRKEN